MQCIEATTQGSVQSCYRGLNDGCANTKLASLTHIRKSRNGNVKVKEKHKIFTYFPAQSNQNTRRGLG